MNEPDSRPGLARKRSLRFAAVVLVATLAIAACWKWLARTPGQILKARLSDGTVVAVSGVSYARTNTFVHANLIERLLGNLISSNDWKLGPVLLSRPIPITSTSGSGEPCLAVEWTVHTPQQAAPSFVGVPGELPRVLLWGDDGIEYLHHIGRGSRRDGHWLMLFQADAFPRDSDFLWLRIEERKFSYDGWEPVATFRIRNPAPRSKVRPWTAPELPTAITNASLSLTVKKLSVVMPGNLPVFMDYAIDNMEEPAEEWSIASVRATDASGNAARWRPALQRVSKPGESQRANFAPALDPRHVWRLEITAHQGSRFATNEIQRVTISPGRQPVLPDGSDDLKVSCAWLSTNHARIDSSHSNTNLAVVILETTGRDARVIVQQSGNPARHFLILNEKDATEDVVPKIALARPRTFVVYAKPKLIELQPRHNSPTNHHED